VELSIAVVQQKDSKEGNKSPLPNLKGGRGRDRAREANNIEILNEGSDSGDTGSDDTDIKGDGNKFDALIAIILLPIDLICF